MHPSLSVHRQRGATEQLGQLARRAAALQVHLEEAFLGVQEAGRPREVAAIPSAKGGHAQLVALDGDGGRQAGERDAALEQGQARPELAVDPHGRGGDGDQQQRGHREQRREDDAARGVRTRRGRGFHEQYARAGDA
jgi:hypothetical protein